MRTIFCLDARDGISFGGRRLSRDRALVDYLCEKYGRIAVSPYSAPLFKGHDVEVSDDPTSSALETNFVEDAEIRLDLTEPDEVVVCRWNREYPSDRKVTVSTAWQPVSTEEIKGSSHDRITITTYRCSAAESSK